MTKIPSILAKLKKNDWNSKFCKKKVCKYSKLGLGKCMPQSVQLSWVENNTMGLKLDICLTKSYFSFLKLCFICLELNWQNENFCVFIPVLPSTALSIGYFWVSLVGNGMCYYFPHYCTFIFQFGFRKCLLCKNTTWMSCIYEISTYINKNASQTLLLNVYSKWFWKLNG